MKAMFTVLLSSLFSFNAYSRDFTPRNFTPEIHQEYMTAEDGSIQECKVFRTIPGVRYQVEFSRDGVNWTLGDEVSGLGHEYVVAIREIKAAPSPPASLSSNKSPNPCSNVSIVLQSVSDEAGGTMVSWGSLDEGGPRRARIGGTLVEGWANFPLYADRYGAYDFFIHHPTAKVPPLKGEELPLGPLDSAMIAVLEKNLAVMNEKIIHSQARIRLAPLTGPADPDERKFMRVKFDTKIDTDMDGSPDWAEFDLAARDQAEAATAPLKNPSPESSEPAVKLKDAQPVPGIPK
ncbi:MAG: hypothetical protein RLZZ214_3118 [Verrucomicrobiota bacterium]|jgi:hypothetical protein